MSSKNAHGRSLRGRRGAWISRGCRCDPRAARNRYPRARLRQALDAQRRGRMSRRRTYASRRAGKAVVVGLKRIRFAPSCSSAAGHSKAVVRRLPPVRHGHRADPAQLAAVTYAARMLRSSAAEHKLVVVVTDAPANDTVQCAQAAHAATSEGVRVIGALKPKNRHQRPGASGCAFMAEEFGSEWFKVESYTQTPHALLEHLGCMPGPGPREARVRQPASERQVPAGHERLVAVAAEALMALGDEAAYELSARTLDASDPQLLRTICACAASSYRRTATSCWPRRSKRLARAERRVRPCRSQAWLGAGLLIAMASGV